MLDQGVFAKAIQRAERLGKLPKVIAIADMTQPSTAKRFYVVDLEHRKLLLRSWVAHGKGSGEDRCVRTSNTNGSLCTSAGLLRVGQRIEIPLALPGTVDRWSYEVVEQATLDTPVGPLPTFHVRPRRELRPNRDLVADAWFAPSLQYLPVRLLIRQDEATYVDLMLERLPQQEAAAAPPAAAASAAPR